MLPALLVLALGLPVTTTLVVSQVLLSFGIPFALIPLILLTRRTDLMGALGNPRWLTVVLSVVAALIVTLNLYLLLATVLT
jgi:manganese transport protein